MKLRDLIEIVGNDASLKLAEQFGGSRLHVPRPESLGPDHPLVLAIGMDAAITLSQRAGGEWTEVPRGHSMLVRKRDAQIAEARRQGISVSAIARTAGLTERGIRLSLARHRAGGGPGKVTE